MPTSEEQPKCSAPHFALDGIEAFIGRFLVHAQRHGNVTGFAETGVLCCIVTLAEVIDTVAVRDSE
jgi:hypothetical protein